MRNKDSGKQAARKISLLHRQTLNAQKQMLRLNLLVEKKNRQAALAAAELAARIRSGKTTTGRKILDLVLAATGKFDLKLTKKLERLVRRIGKISEPTPMLIYRKRHSNVPDSEIFYLAELRGKTQTKIELNRRQQRLVLPVSNAVRHAYDSGTRTGAIIFSSSQESELKFEYLGGESKTLVTIEVMIGEKEISRWLSSQPDHQEILIELWETLYPGEQPPLPEERGIPAMLDYAAEASVAAAAAQKS